MHLRWVALTTFRSYPQLEWRPVEGINVLVGRNGAGKTNLLEAIAYLATLRSFRGSPDEALVAEGHDTAVVRGEVERSDSSALIEVELAARGGRRVLLNRRRLRRAAELVGEMRVVTFLPEDLDIVKRGPANRRAFLDEVAVALWPAAHLDQTELERALRQRNAFLRRHEEDEVTLGVWDERVSQAGAKVTARRARVAAAIRGIAARAYQEIAGIEVEVELEYVSAWGGTLDPDVAVAELAVRLGEALARARRVDRERGVTTVGPQRDEPAIRLDGRDLRTGGSQGEQRSMALSLRLAAHRAVTELTGVPPLLLLDDVFSELDAYRSRALVEVLPRAQTFVTTAHPEDVPLSGRRWEVAEGGVR